MVLLAQATFEAPSPVTADTDATLFRHVKRPQWGVAILAWERKKTRAYQFEDGKLRKIREGYYKLMEPVEDFEGPEQLVKKNLLRVAEAGSGEDTRTVQEAVCAFDDQVELFTRLYPEGFADPQWIEDHRRPSDGNALKRHREPIVAEAREALSEENCKTLTETGKHEELADIVIDILGRTDLVPISHVKVLRRLDPDEKHRYAESLVDLMHGERSFQERYKDYLELLTELLGNRPSWRAGTVLPAILKPQEHVPVRRSAFARQAGSIAPTAKYARRTGVRSYKNFRRVAVAVRKRLLAAGHEPRDMLDVYDFVWNTLRTSALDHLGNDDD